MVAVDVVAASGFVAVCVIGVVWRRREVGLGVGDLSGSWVVEAKNNTDFTD
jgi:hypothetical protein